MSQLDEQITLEIEEQVVSEVEEKVKVKVSIEQRDKIFNQYQEKAIKLARKKHRGVPPSVCFEDLKSAALMGLLDAASNRDMERTDQEFERMMTLRVYGSMLDFLRKCYWGGKNHPYLHYSLNSPLDKTDNECDTMADTIKDGVDLPDLDRKDLISFVLRPLPVKARVAIYYYYFRQETMHDIAKAMKISESRVSQMITQALADLKEIHSFRKFELFQIFGSTSSKPLLQYSQRLLKKNETKTVA